MTNKSIVLYELKPCQKHENQGNSRFNQTYQ